MTRRSVAHDYSRPGIYHITMRVADGMGSPLGKVIGDVQALDGSPDAPRVALSPVGQMVERELLTAIHAHYPMVEVQDHVVMPDHLHAIVVVKEDIVNASGHSTHLGQVIKGFKYGCNRRYWEMLGLPVGKKERSTESTATVHATVPADSVGVVHGGSYPPLFSLGYCDVMPVDEAQLATQRAYIRANPRSRLLLVIPWSYQYRGRQEAITVPECKTMNCVAQAICRTRDGWWKERESTDSIGGNR